MLLDQNFHDYQSADIGIQTAGATSQQLVLIMFNGLMDELVRARGHIEAKRYEHKANSINKCIDVLNALTGSLDFIHGGELATNTANLYSHCVYRLYDASIKMSSKHIDEVEKIIATLRTGWEGNKEC
ncbi:flagellar export chaperone FliS [Yersinia aleksiciae]|uniref:Flagellar secretion chaperone FliS n=1 Tax=Yersinia aleksiciae TaxID=263819 RepID=A0A0T9U671_YERAE|nr:flagellar export chaperone FliS [Yersinia aleksiciae]AKP33097.1 flagellar biosynthesis protein FliS [Yersinia aleksiciae]MDN0122260.1 flagellar export chaperone FliS [Yersinia aleksiciae]CFQ48713.1 flagellin-specific chaperon FliS [Yersinia aleksiciae]CNL22047.1 flagellin-specific chaperon FliS [Yersinia aleksiciae]